MALSPPSQSSQDSDTHPSYGFGGDGNGARTGRSWQREFTYPEVADNLLGTRPRKDTPGDPGASSTLAEKLPGSCPKVDTGAENRPKFDRDCPFEPSVGRNVPKTAEVPRTSANVGRFGQMLIELGQT